MLLLSGKGVDGSAASSKTHYQGGQQIVILNCGADKPRLDRLHRRPGDQSISTYQAYASDRQEIPPSFDLDLAVPIPYEPEMSRRPFIICLTGPRPNRQLTKAALRRFTRLDWYPHRLVRLRTSRGPLRRSAVLPSGTTHSTGGYLLTTPIEAVMST